MTRRRFLKTSLTASLALGLPSLTRGAATGDPVRLAIVGLGGLNIPGSVGGRGRQLINALRKVPEAQIVALCDVDQSILDNGVGLFKERDQKVAAYNDIRQVLDDKSVDAVVVALPNHWHALAAVWTCQAGKDAYVEKPFSHDIWEGRQMAAAARKHNRIVQVGTQSRSSSILRQAFDYIHAGELGAIRYAHALVYRPREGIEKVSAPTPPPPTVNYDLWCGPVAKGPLMRKHLHYEWHWFWDTGNGEMGNNGVHVIDICRWALNKNELPPRVISIAGRFSAGDNAETANTHIALFEYKPAPLICEVRNLRIPASKHGIGKFRNADHGVMIDCEGGYITGDANSVDVFDRQGQKVKSFREPAKEDIEVVHLANFVAAVRSRNASSLAADARQGHLSAGCCHMANVSHRLGKHADPEAIKEAARSDSQLLETFEGCREYLLDNGVDLGSTHATLGPRLTMDPAKDRFSGPFAAEANALSRRTYRAPFTVPELA